MHLNDPKDLFGQKAKRYRHKFMSKVAKMAWASVFFGAMAGSSFTYGYLLSSVWFYTLATAFGLVAGIIVGAVDAET